MRTVFASLVLLALSFVCAYANTAEPSNQLTRELDSEEPWDFDGFYGADRDLMGYEDRDLMGYEDRDLIEELNIRDLNGIDKEKDRELVDGEDEEFEKRKLQPRRRYRSNYGRPGRRRFRRRFGRPYYYGYRPFNNPYYYYGYRPFSNPYGYGWY